MEIKGNINAGYGNSIGSGATKSSIVGGSQNSVNGDHSSIVGGMSNTIVGTSTDSFIGGGIQNSLTGTSSGSVVVGGKNNIINNSVLASILGGYGNTVNHTNSHIIGSNITSVAINTTHVEGLNIGTIGGGTPVGNLGFDSSGNVVTGTTTVDTDTFVTGGTYSSGTATFTNNTGGTFNVTGFTQPFTGNTSGDCITDLYVSNLYGCSPINVNDETIFNQNLTAQTITITSGEKIVSSNGDATLDLSDQYGPNGTWSITSDNGGYGAGSTWIYGQPNNGAQLSYQKDISEAIGIGIYSSGVSEPLLNTAKEIVIIDNTSGSTKNSGDMDKRAIFIGTRNSTFNTNVTNSVVIGGVGLSATQDDTVYVDNLNINTIGGGSPVINLGLDSSGNVVTGTTGGGGMTIDPYFTEPSALSITWNVSGNSTNYQTVLTGNTTLNLSNVRNGDYGTIIVQQDGVGSRTITFGTVNGAGSTHRVVNGGAGIPVLTSNPNAIDILTFTYNGSVMYWTVGNDYT